MEGTGDIIVSVQSEGLYVSPKGRWYLKLVTRTRLLNLITSELYTIQYKNDHDTQAWESHLCTNSNR